MRYFFFRNINHNSHKPDSNNKYGYGTTLVLKKENPRQIFKDMTGILRGAWRSRTALSGFADQYLTVRTTHRYFCFSKANAKVISLLR